MKDVIKKLVCEYVSKYQDQPDIFTNWGEPIVGFADSFHPAIQNLRKVISEEYILPQDIMSDTTCVICYYVPFTKELAETNKLSKDTASPEWARAYEETNAMFVKLNDYLVKEISKMGYKAAPAKEAVSFDKASLTSRWSYRHIAFAAGLGTFGLNNMLITKNGCCGRYNTLITNLPITPDDPMEEELCIYKKSGRCKVCMHFCPAGAITECHYDRHKCFEVLKKNEKIHIGYGSSYIDETGKPDSSGSQVCGKCIVNAPCAFWSK